MRTATVAVLLLGACTFEAPDPPAAATTWFGDDAAPVSPPAPVLRRLTASQLLRSAQHVLGSKDSGSKDITGAGLPLDGVVGAFASNVHAPLTGSGVDALMRFAERAGASFEPAPLVACNPKLPSCRPALTAAVLRRAFRRPPTEQEVQRYVGLEPWSPSALVAAALQSPHFLYLVERGVPVGPATPDVLRLTGYEVASRMAFALWDGPPDDTLLDAAQRGELDTRDGIEVHARRMWLDVRARTGIRRFVAQWFGIERLTESSKSSERFPGYDPEVLLADSLAFAESVIIDEGGTLHGLLYGDDRAGMLTRPAWAAAHAHADVTSPTRRGRFVRERLLCQSVPSPPGTLVVAPLTFDPTATPREQLAEHAHDPSCSGCHDLMDPLGFGFEAYDAAGRWRDQYPNGRSLDRSGELVLDGRTQPFESGRALAGWLAASPTVRRCVARQWLRFALGRPDEAADEASLASMVMALDHSDGTLREMMIGLMVTDAFRYRKGATR